MKRIALFCVSIFVLTNLLYSQDIINETGKDGKFIVRDNDEKEVMIIDEGDVSITGSLKVEELEEGSKGDKVVVWDSEDKKFKALYNMIPSLSVMAADSWTEDGSGNIYRATGMVGIGTTTPERILDINPSVAGSAQLMRESDSDLFAINLKSLGNRGEILLYKDGSPTVKLTGFGLSYFTSSRLGIFTTNPQAYLSVGGQGVLEAAIYGKRAKSDGIGIYGDATGSAGTGIYGVVSGTSGKAVYGYASNDGDVTNYGVYGDASGKNGYGVYGKARGRSGYGVYGIAGESELIAENYGGYFKARGNIGYGVYGIATNNGLDRNYGGYFQADGVHGVGVYGKAAGSNGNGVVGWGSSYNFDAQGPGLNYGATSSIRWKKDIVEIDNPLDKINEIRGVYFNWDKEHGGRHDIGCIAEEVGKVLPEIVVYEENGIDADGMDYSKLAPLLVEAVKELSKIADEQQKRIEYLESKF